ncbi:MAG: hypothetical protein LBJ41_07465 [Treponema sp.]|jgi:hypothetical protein|nr:hypothetical protein [Treponema sp.]
MKQATFVMLLLVGINAAAFSLQEAWLSTGFEFGNSFENSPDEGSVYTGAPGFNLNLYGFQDRKNIGAFAHYSFLFPVISSRNGDLEDYDFQFQLILGPGFRFHITEDLKLRCGIGFDFMYIYAIYNQKDATGNTIDFLRVASHFGIGGDIGIKYDITDSFYINGGITLSYTVKKYMYVYSWQETSNDERTQTRIEYNNITGYSMFDIKPYLGIGFNSYQEKAVWGKPK